MNKDKELYAIAAALNSAYARNLVLEGLKLDDFRLIESKEIYRSIREIVESQEDISLPRVSEIMRKNGGLANIGGIKILTDISFLGGEEIDIDFYVSLIKKESLRRNMQIIGHEFLQKASSDEPETLIDQTIQKLNDLQTNSAADFRPMVEVYDNFRKGMSFEEYFRSQCALASSGTDVFEGYRTGYPQLDTIIGGFERGTNNIIGASTSAGKTTFFINLFLNIRTQYPKARIGFFSLEMPTEKIFAKIVTTFAGIHVDRTIDFRPSTEEMERILESAKILRDMEIYFDDCAGITINQVKSKTRRAVMREKMDIIFVDYLTRIQGDRRSPNKHLEIDQISKGLQDMALDLGIPIVTLAQLNRNAGTRERPTLSDLRESGSIEEDADTVLLLNRPNRMKLNDYTECQVAKNRIRGNLGFVNFEYQNGRLFEMEKIEEQIKKAKENHEWRY